MSLSKLAPEDCGRMTYGEFDKKSVSPCKESVCNSLVESLSKDTPPLTPEPATSAYFA